MDSRTIQRFRQHHNSKVPQHKQRFRYQAKKERRILDALLKKNLKQEMGEDAVWKKRDAAHSPNSDHSSLTHISSVEDSTKGQVGFGSPCDSGTPVNSVGVPEIDTSTFDEEMAILNQELNMQIMSSSPGSSQQGNPRMSHSPSVASHNDTGLQTQQPQQQPQQRRDQQRHQH
eukprot:m.4190 g.4190  ORF g.4190 m.4190 type:complete len:173 (-) comp3837_c0_seq1:3438-3956(-)